ncbi:peptidoglycan-binding domain-containing protein [Leptolyngbya ohadii]|uniref:peptidoglycan-binding domain-containing protein n=1 Tax=Leptolyngbya ohadii TaxID=1962290 RepID=UPI000B5A04B4|nr:peptidoglycan-binding protein [Leptolyngbya ohadii]
MELFAQLQIAQDYEQSYAEDWVNLIDTVDRPSTPNRSVNLLQPGMHVLLAFAALWSTGLSGTATAVEEYDPGFRPGGDSTFVPVSPTNTANQTVSQITGNCASAICQAACGNNNDNSGGGGTNVVVVPPVQRPIINVTDNNFVAVRPSQPAGVFVRRGDVGPEVTRVQDLLRSAGYFHAASTGFFATLTEEGVKAFQRDRGLGVDGIVGEETLTALQGFRPVSPRPLPDPQPILVRLQIGDRGPDVVRLQIALFNLGFYRGEIDGVYAAATEQSVIALQQAYNLPISGIADSTTLARLGLTVDRVAAR